MDSQSAGNSGRQSSKKRAGRIYFTGEIASKLTQRHYRVAITCIGEAGTAECSGAATSLIYDYRPKILILVGIAAGLKSKTKIGDVIISEIVWGYEKASLETGHRREIRVLPRPDVGRIDFSVQQDIATYLSGFEKEYRIEEHFMTMGGKYPQPGEKNQALYTSHVLAKPRIIHGTLASGNKLLKNPNFLHSMQVHAHSRIKAGEMEASGLVAACRQQKVPWLVVRGISDFGDRFKSDDFHAFAAQMAAAVLRDFIVEGLDLAIAKHRRVRKVPVSATTPSVTQLQRVAEHIKKIEAPGHILTPGRQNILELARPFHSRVFRVVRKDFSRNLVSTGRSGKWHPLYPALYFATTATTAFLQSFRFGPQSLILESMMISSLIAEFDVRLSRVLDLTDYRTKARLNVDSGLLLSQDVSYTQSIGDAAHAARCEGLLVPSIADMRSSYLVVFQPVYRQSNVNMLKVTSLTDSSDFSRFLEETGTRIVAD
jgi:nucleoside phosphorylase